MWSKIKQSGSGVTKRFFQSQDSRPCVGLDIGNFACKFVELKRGPNGCQITAWANEPVQGGDKIGATKKVLAKVSSPGAVLPVTAVAGKGTLTRFIEMPKMPIGDLKKSFAIEADKYFPFPLDQIYTDCYILDPNYKGNKMRVLVAAAKKELVDQRLGLMTEMGFHADCVTLNAIAVANVMQELGGQKAENMAADAKTPAPAVGILDVGELMTNLTILVAGTPRFIRDISVGGKDFSRAISNSLGVSLEEAARMKMHPGDKRQALVEACETAVMNLVSEIRLSLDYFMTEENMPVSQIYLTGGTAALEGIEDAFSKNLELKTIRWNPFQNVVLAEYLKKEDFDKDAAQLVVALGLALSSG